MYLVVSAMILSNINYFLHILNFKMIYLYCIWKTELIKAYIEKDKLKDLS